MNALVETTLNEGWSWVRDRLREEFGEATFNNWLGPLDIESLEDGAVVLSAPTRFLRDWVAPRYGDRIRALWRRRDGSVQTVEILVKTGAPRAARQPVTPSEASPGTTQGPVANSASQVDAALDPRCPFENFVVGKPN